MTQYPGTYTKTEIMSYWACLVVAAAIVVTLCVMTFEYVAPPHPNDINECTKHINN